MSVRTFSSFTRIAAPRFLGALFCSALLLSAASCNRKSEYVQAPTPGETASTDAEEDVSFGGEKIDPNLGPIPAADPTEFYLPPRYSPLAAIPENLRFISYNVENWLTIERKGKDGETIGRPKPESEKAAVIRILSRQQPDVIGLCEIGTTADLADVQKRLADAGVSYPYSHHAGGSDEVRHLGLLSRFPIAPAKESAKTVYEVDGKVMGINRGILDVSARVRNRTYRFIGVHLKSRRETMQADQDTIRLSEARMLRRHLDSLFPEHGDPGLVVYGDFNDTKASTTVKTITGKARTKSYVAPIPLKDALGQTWTHYWETNDIYSRFDFIMVSPALRTDVNMDKSRVINDAEWPNASDHRPVMVVFN